MNEEDFNNFKEQKKSAFILGYTGESGKALVNELVNSQLFHTVRLIGRREVSYPDEDKYKCLEQKVVDFDNISAHQAEFAGCDVGFCCLGTTRRKSGKAGFYKVDHDYIVNSAKVAKDSGCKDFHLVSSKGADERSIFFYLKVKGQVEAEIQALNFERYSVYRPAALMCEREDSRCFETVTIAIFFAPLQKVAPTALTTPTTTMAKAMANKCVLAVEEAFVVHENKSIFRLAGELK